VLDAIYVVACRRIALLVGGDTAALLLFAAIGRRNHGEGLQISETFNTALPFLVGLCFLLSTTNSPCFILWSSEVSQCMIVFWSMHTTTTAAICRCGCILPSACKSISTMSADSAKAFAVKSLIAAMLVHACFQNSLQVVSCVVLLMLHAST
jgi:hypothetical protein